MVGHDHKFTQFDVRAKDGCLVPFVAHNFSQIIQYHFPVHNFAKQVFALMRTQGDEIRPGAGGIKAGQADGAAAACGGVGRHGWGGWGVGFRGRKADRGEREQATPLSPTYDTTWKQNCKLFGNISV